MDPSHITEFASPRYFDKLRSLQDVQEHANLPEGEGADVAGASTVTTQPAAQSHSTFSLPFHPRPYGGRRRRSDDTERSGDGPKRRLLVPEGKNGRKQSFTSSIASFKFKVGSHKITSTHVEQSPFICEEEPPKPSLTLAQRILQLPNELQLQVITFLPLPTILSLRLASKAFHALISFNESPITRYHLAHSVPHYALKLYPVPDSTLFTLQYLCGLWHRLHVAAKLADLIAEHTTQEIFLRNTPPKRRDFEPQHRRMRIRLMPLLFTMFHFFERYRQLHLQHLQNGGVPLNHQSFTLNPIEREIMYGYDDRTLLELHQVFPLVLSSFTRRFRPPSYVGSLERKMKGYLKDKPADEIYATILLIGGLRQAGRFWETKGYNSRRAVVDNWYGSITREPIALPHRSRFAVLGLGRKKADKPVLDPVTGELPKIHDVAKCREWDCVNPACIDTRTQDPLAGLVFHTSLAAGPPMKPLNRDELRPLLADQQPLHSIWCATAEAVILERGIVENSGQIKRNTQVLLELIREDGAVGDVEWEPALRVQSKVPVGMGGMRDLGTDAL